MDENLESALTSTVTDTDQPRPQNAGAALVSAIIPGVGQVMLGEKLAGGIFLVLAAFWAMLFFAPIRLPRLYHGWLSLILAGVILAVVASSQALRSKSDGRQPGRWMWLFCTLPLALITPLVLQAILLRVGGFRAFNVPSSSMERTIQNGDLVMTDMHFYRRHRPTDGEIILFKSPETPGIILIKRLVAKSGDTIMSLHGNVSLNGTDLNESYVEHTGEPTDDLMNFGPLTIPPHKLFFMGDNRDLSLDSRMTEFGLIDESAVLGKALYIVTPAHDRSGEPLR
jgi:signal peptidase I